MKYRKKPVVIEAFQFYVDNMPDWFMDAVSNDEVILYNCDLKRYTIDEAYCRIRTLEGWHWCNGGDYVIKGIKGELYPCKADIFNQTYEEVKKMTKIQELEQKVKELSEEIEQLKNQEKGVCSRFVPKEDEKFWVINMWGKADWFVWNDKDDANKYLLDNSPLFPTKEEAERYLKFKQELAKRRWLVTEEEWEDDNILKYYIEIEKDEIAVEFSNVYRKVGTIYFKTEESAKYIIDNFSKELKEYWL